jgi:DNA-binding phage protein
MPNKASLRRNDMDYKKEIEKIETKARMDRYVTALLETRKDELEMAICDGTINKALKTIWYTLYKLEGEPDYGCILKICRAIGLSKAVFNYGRMD